uniref:Uncharacterized protein n=2 Tax=Stomoxys calcitrans TaxID=35570 RepID=A0A1I8Q745_STOCA
MASAYRTDTEVVKPATGPAPPLSTMSKVETTKIRKREVVSELREHILIVTINRPQSRNALNRNAIYDLIAAFADATYNKDIKVVVLTGCGDIFSAGNDLKQIQDYPSPEDYFYGANYILKSLIKSVLVCPKLTVCLVNGPCIGIGFTLAALCDLVYCSRAAYFHTPFSQLGLCAEACSSYTFPQLFGTSWASKLLMLGEKLTAEQAHQFGFVVELYDSQQEVQEKFWPKMHEYTRLPYESLHATKQLMRLHRQPQLLKALDEELKQIAKLRQGPVYRRAIEEFSKKSKSINKSKL